MTETNPSPRRSVPLIGCLILAAVLTLFVATCCGLCMLPGLLETDEDRAARQAQLEERAAARANRRSSAEAMSETERAYREVMPESQYALCGIVQEHGERYREASTDLQRGRIRSERGEALRDALEGGEVHHWIGSVNRLTTTGQGNVALRIDLPCGGIRLGTADGELTDSVRADRGANTLIDRDSPLYDPLAELEQGDWILFSGALIPHERDGFEDASFTEHGTMTTPYFLFRISALHPGPE